MVDNILLSLLIINWPISKFMRLPSQARQDRETKKNTPATEKPWSRWAPFDFTGCTAHVEIVECTHDGEITCVIGIFEHNTVCQAATLKRLPAIPLHDHVYEVALEQMEDGAK